MVTSYGSVPFKDNMARGDSIQVARLKAAGAIVIGKTTRRWHFVSAQDFARMVTESYRRPEAIKGNLGVGCIMTDQNRMPAGKCDRLLQDR